MALSTRKTFSFTLVAGTAKYFETADNVVTTPGFLQILIQEVVPAGKLWKLQQAFVSCRIDTKWSFRINSVQVASGRTGAGHPDSNFSWFPARSVAQGIQIRLELFAKSGIPPSDIEAYLQLSEE